MIATVSSTRPLDPGTRLREARERRGLSSRQIAEVTKLSVRAIEALEADRLGELPGGVYRRSIVRAVAHEVGLDPAQVLREFADRHPDELPEPPRAAQVLAPAPARRASLERLIALAGAVLPIAAGAAYFLLASPSGRAPAVPRPAVDRLHTEAVQAGGFVEPPAPVRRGVVVTLTVSSRCHLRVSADGREVLGRIVEAGESFPVELVESVVLSGDNAGAVQFSINGQAGRLLGAPGEPLSVRIGRDDYETLLVRP